MRELEGVAPGDGALALPHHAQHGAIVQVRGREAARGQRHRHRAQQRGQQGDQVQEFLGAVQGLPHLGPPAFQRLHPHAANGGLLHFLQGPFDEGADLPVRPATAKR